MSTSFSQLILLGVILAAIQVAAALPWIWAWVWANDSRGFKRNFTDTSFLGLVFGVVLIAGGLVAGWLYDHRVESSVSSFGQYYACVLHIQLALDFFVIAPRLLILIWPKGGAVALAAFRESYRQPLFWLIGCLSVAFIMIAMFIPYFTFGEDYKMMKQLCFDVAMLASAGFGLLTASLSVYEEIEGRTAITVISKPISRRAFFLGKYLGILLACWAMMMFIGWAITWALEIKPMFDRMDEVHDTLSEDYVKRLSDDHFFEDFPRIFPTLEGSYFREGILQWFGKTGAVHMGLVLSFGHVMILLAICVALATRMPFVSNLVICILVFIIGRLAPVLAQVTHKLAEEEKSAAFRLIAFIAQLFNSVFPSLEYFDMGPAIVRDNPLTSAAVKVVTPENQVPHTQWAGTFEIYVLSVLGYATLYTAIALVIGLLLFEDRDLA